MPKYVEINEDEAWAIDHTIRHTYADGPSNVGRELLVKVMHLVLEFEERRGKPFAPQVLPLALTEDECWAIDHQIRCDLTVNGKPVGRGLLLKIFQALTEFANDRDAESGVEQLGSLADLLRAPQEENPSDPPESAPPPDSEPRGGRADPNRSGRHPSKPEDDAPGPAMRDK